MSFKISRNITIKEKQKIGRNDPCSCGSGKKYKKCCLRREQDAQQSRIRTSNLIDPMVEWVVEQDFFDRLFEKWSKKIFGKNRSFEETELKALTETLIFEGEHDGKTLFAHFVEKAEMPERDRAAYQTWLEKGRFSLFEVLEVKLGTWLRVRDLANGEELTVYEHLGSYNLEEKVILPARIVPSQHGYIFTGGISAFLPKEAGYTFKRNAISLSKSKTPQMNFIQAWYDVPSSSQKQYSKLTYPKLKKELIALLDRHNTDFSIEDIEHAIETDDLKKFNRFINKLLAYSASDEEFENTRQLTKHFWHEHPRNRKHLKELGQKEQQLTNQLMQELMQQENLKELPEKKRQKKIDRFVQNWLKTPQEELDGKTPAEVVGKERKNKGKKETEFKPRITLEAYDPLEGADEELVGAYQKAMYKMRKDHEFYQALLMFAELTERVDELPDPFRWYLNVGGCLANLGEIKLARKFNQKALKLNPRYKLAKENLQRLKDKEIILSQKQIGKQNLFDALLKENKLTLECPALKKSELLSDFRMFLKQAEKQNLPITKKWRVLTKKTVLKLNRKLQTPDPEQLEFKGISKKEARNNYAYNAEWQFPKINLLRVVSLAGKLVKEDKNRIIITNAGREFGKLSAGEQFSLILRAWLYTADPAESSRKDAGKISMSFMQKAWLDFAYLIFLRMGQSGRKALTAEELAGTDEQPTPEEKQSQEEKLLDNMIAAVSLRKNLLRRFIWAGLVGVEKPQRGVWVRESHGEKVINQLIPELQEKYRLTKLGHAVLKAIDKSLHAAIPTPLRTVV